MKNKIKQIETLVEQACRSENNIFGYSIWTYHITQVVSHALSLAKQFHADPVIVEIAALLHDYAGIKDKRFYNDHHIYGQIEAECILKELDFSEDTIAAVKHCIAAHRGSVPGERNSPEAECVANADAMTHIEQIPALLFSAYKNRGMGIDEATAWLRRKLQRSWNKLSPPVQDMMQEKYAAALMVLGAAEK